MLSFISGESPHPQGWSDEGAAAVGVLLREFHRAAAKFVPPADATWMPWYARDLVGKAPVIGHCDTAAWNILARDGRPVALVDWDTAGPFDTRWELAQTVWLNAQLHDDDVADRVGLPDAAARARQARLMLDGYGLVEGPHRLRASDGRVRNTQRRTRSDRCRGHAHRNEPGCCRRDRWRLATRGRAASLELDLAHAERGVDAPSASLARTRPQLVRPAF